MRREITACAHWLLACGLVQDGWTALLMASWGGHTECRHMLRLAGATVESAKKQTCCKAAYLEARRLIYQERKRQSEGTLPPEYVRLGEIAPRADQDLIEARMETMSPRPVWNADAPQ